MALSHGGPSFPNVRSWYLFPYSLPLDNRSIPWDAATQIPVSKDEGLQCPASEGLEYEIHPSAVQCGLMCLSRHLCFRYSGSLPGEKKHTCKARIPGDAGRGAGKPAERYACWFCNTFLRRDCL